MRSPCGTIRLRDGADPLARQAVSSKKFVPGEKGEIRLWNKVAALKLAVRILGLGESEPEAVPIEIDKVVINCPPRPEGAV
jgi:hypothetical protein